MSDQHPFWLPKGSVRAFLAVVLVGGSLTCVFTGVSSAEAIHTLAGVAVTFYFNTRAQSTPGNG